MRSRKPEFSSFQKQLARAYERRTSNQLELPFMSSDEKRTFLDNIFDAADSIADKMVAGAKHVHTPDKEYVDESPIASGTQSIASGTQSFMMAPLENQDARGAVWHVFRVPTVTLCGLRANSPESFWRANKSSRAAILTCFGCLSHALSRDEVSHRPVLELKP
jgi:hypothetical protein